VYVAGAGPVGLACAASCQLLGAAVVIVGDIFLSAHHTRQSAWSRIVRTASRAEGREFEPEWLAPQPEFELWLTASGFQNKSLSFCFARVPTTAMNGRHQCKRLSNPS
jgi:glutathione-independent formaldehyde dehydrogenase